MANIQKALDALQPYVIGIRYLEGLVLVDVVFKEGWTLPEDAHIKREQGDKALNYFMLFSQSPHIGLDELLAYVEKTIKLNQEREKKQELLKVMLNDLKKIFNSNSLAKLQKLKFKFDDEIKAPKLEDLTLDIENEIEPQEYVEEEEEETQDPEWAKEEYVEPPITQQVEYLDENKNPIILTDEDRELMAEEARAERNRQLIEKRKEKRANAPALPKNKVELPPRRTAPMPIAETVSYGSCNCGPDEACGECIDSKGY